MRHANIVEAHVNITVAGRVASKYHRFLKVHLQQNNRLDKSKKG